MHGMLEMTVFANLFQMHGGGAKKGGSGTDEVVNNEPSKRGGAIGGKRGGKASGEQLKCASHLAPAVQLQACLLRAVY